MASKARKAGGSSKARRKVSTKKLWAAQFKKAQEAQKKDAAKIAAQRKAGKKVAKDALAQAWKKNLGKASTAHAKTIERAKGPLVRTRSTATHNAIKDRLDEVEAGLLKELGKKRLPKDKRDLYEKALNALREEREKQKNDPKAMVPVGMISGGMSGVIQVDHYRGGLGSYASNARMINTGEQFLGVMENWLQVVTVLSAQPFGGPLPSNWSPTPPPADVVQRIKDFPQIMGIGDAEREAWVQAMIRVWQICEHRGALLVFEMDYEETQKGAG